MNTSSSFWYSLLLTELGKSKSWFFLYRMNALIKCPSFSSFLLRETYSLNLLICFYNVDLLMIILFLLILELFFYFLSNTKSIKTFWYYLSLFRSNSVFFLKNNWEINFRISWEITKAFFKNLFWFKQLIVIFFEGWFKLVFSKNRFLRDSILRIGEFWKERFFSKFSSSEEMTGNCSNLFFLKYCWKFWGMFDKFETYLSNSSELYKTNQFSTLSN